MPTEPSAIDALIGAITKLPGFGPRSARRVALHMIQKPELVLHPLIHALQHVAESVQLCAVCGNLDTKTPCSICTAPKRATGALCVVKDVTDLWAIERSDSYNGRYHVLGGTLSAITAASPDKLRIPDLLNRLTREGITEVILALNTTLDGQTTAYYLSDALADRGVALTSLGQGVPLGGELDYLDNGTIRAALDTRRNF